ncbi:hypothetical protein P0W64_02255 [Tsukamurella sp. 8F]|uniref:hypothetical protein n=1 Tax=unclassified Tsukamurella TaxID=2633480 RepID=UPI0023BA0E93|nr:MULTISPECIES: hypothetical protein [unclassified Tsukamurella]MDF0528632.1 hypothetical protein [Tsukamurella sp. 8J]MDF0585594.1 hypothetical protein [Tsukamurella sp. 8F]
MSAPHARPGTQPVLPVPVGTPGRDPRAGLPPVGMPGPQQPWRRHGPGTRAWVAVVTAVACVLLVVVTLTALVIGAVKVADRESARSHNGTVVVTR